MKFNNYKNFIDAAVGLMHKLNYVGTIVTRFIMLSL